MSTTKKEEIIDNVTEEIVNNEINIDNLEYETMEKMEDQMSKKKPEITDSNLTIVAILHTLTFFTGIIAFIALIFYYVFKKDEMTGSEENACKNTINFHLSFMLYLIISAVLMIILIGFIGLIVFGLVYFVVGIIGIFKLFSGEEYEYIWTIKFLK